MDCRTLIDKQIRRQEKCHIQNILRFSGVNHAKQRQRPFRSLSHVKTRVTDRTRQVFWGENVGVSLEGNLHLSWLEWDRHKPRSSLVFCKHNVTLDILGSGSSDRWQIISRWSLRPCFTSALCWQPLDGRQLGACVVRIDHLLPHHAYAKRHRTAVEE